MLMPVSALPGAYGIGCFSKEAYEFVDILKEAGQKLWQILPLGQTGYGDSPYQSFSTFAGNPYFIDLETLIEDELLTKEECDQADFGENEEEIDYEKIYNARFKVLKLAYARAKKNGLMESKAYRTYLEEEKAWLKCYINRDIPDNLNALFIGICFQSGPLSGKQILQKFIKINLCT